MSTDAKSIYTSALHNTHAEEHQGLVQMETQLNRLSEYPEYKAIVEAHIGRTKTQLQRIETALGEVGSSPSAVKEAVTTTVGAIGATMHGLTGDPVLKDLYAGYAYQYHQIAAYTSLAVIAQAAGFGGHASWIKQTIDEEEAAAKRVAGIIESVTSAYVAKELRG